MRESGPMTVPDKSAFLELALSGKLGNQVEWYTGEEFLRRKFDKSERWGVRIHTPSSPYMQYHLTTSQAKRIIRGNPANTSAWRMAPDHLLILQGEVCRLPGGLYLRYNTTPGVTMREGMRKGRDAFGLTARLLLERSLDAPSMDFLRSLWDDYSDSVVELTAYSIRLGHLKWNTIFWEVRNY